MRICKDCKCLINDNEVNCPVCGAHTQNTEDKLEMVSGTYPKNNVEKNKKTIIHDVFVGIFVMILASFILVSILTKNPAFVLIAGTSIAYIWLTVFRNIFLPREVSTILTTVFGYTLVVFNAIILHYYCQGNTNILGVSIGIVSPIILAVMNVVFLFATFITRKWYKYSFHDVVIGIVEIIWLIACIVAKIYYVASIVSAGIGFITIGYLLIFQRKVVISEFKKRLHL